MPPDWLSLIANVVAHPHVAGLLGSALSLKWAPAGFWGKAFAFGCGVAGFLYAAPAAIAWLGIKSGAGPAVFALLFGMFGRHFAAKALEALEAFDWRAMDWRAVAAKVLPPFLANLVPPRKDLQ